MHTQQPPLTLHEQNATDAGDLVLCSGVAFILLGVLCVGFIRDGWRRNKHRHAYDLWRESQQKRKVA